MDVMELRVFGGLKLYCRKCGKLTPYGRMDVANGICNECKNEYQRERKRRKRG